MAEMAIDSLSKPPATERIRWAGSMAMKKVAAVAASAEPVHSHESRPVKMVATAPKPAGMKTHTSCSEMSTPAYSVSARCSPHAVNCSPG